MLQRLTLAALLAAATLGAQNTGTVTPVGPGCGPELKVTFAPVGSHNKLTLEVANAFPREKVFSIWGFTPLSFSFPNGCTLYNDFVWGTSAVADATGYSSFARAWPNSIPGFFRIQYVAVRVDANGNLDWRLSNGVLVECKP